MEEALNAVKQNEQLLHLTPVKTTGDYAAFSDRLLSATKAISSATAQLIQAKGNPEKVGALAKSIASIVPDLIQATNSVAGTAPNREAGQGVIQSTKALMGELSNLFQAARNATSRNGDTDGEGGNLNNAAKSVSEAVRDLMARLERTSPAQKEISAALQDVRHAVAKLSDSSLVGVGSPLDGITQAAKGLADAVSQLISSRESPEKMSENARKAADNMGLLIDCTKASAATASGPVKQGLETLAKAVQDACGIVANMSSTPNQNEAEKKKIIAAAKNAALATSALVSVARDSAQAMKANDPEDSRLITNAAQAVATIAARLVNCMFYCFVFVWLTFVSRCQRSSIQCPHR